MHRLLMDAPPELQVDHINGDPLDNRRSNLRLATNVQNQHNKGAWQGAASRFKGVSRTRQPDVWRATIESNGHQITIGRFRSEFEAAKAYDAQARELFGEFARTNFEKHPSDAPVSED
jgi:hypothetical protein